FDANNPSAATHVLNIKSPVCTFEGTGIISRASAGTATVFGQLNFSRAGSTLFYRNTSTHDLQQVKITVKNGCTLDASGSAFGLQISSHNDVALSSNMLTIGEGISGILDMGAGTITGKSVNDYYSGIILNSGSKLRTANINGLYDDSQNTCIAAHVFSTSANHRMELNINANSTIEYYATANQLVTGKYPNGESVSNIASGTSAQYKYGILDINHQGTAGTNYAYLAGNNVFVRTRLDLTNGEFRLSDGGSVNGYTVTIENGNNNAVTSTDVAYIRSECVNGSNINNAQLDWQNIGASANEYTFPYGMYHTVSLAIKKLPVKFTPSGSPAILSLKISTRATGSDNCLWSGISVGGNVAAVSNIDMCEPNSALSCVIDRWWDFTINDNITDMGGSGATVSFSYLGDENTVPQYPTNEIGVMHWNGSTWDNGKGVTGESTPTGYAGNQTSGQVNTVIASGLTKFSPYILVKRPNGLPVELLFFNCQCRGAAVEFNWATASEMNNDYFTIERSSDGILFQPVHIEKGAGNSNTIITYSFINNVQTRHGVSYFRLKQTDYDGNFKYSDEIYVNCSGEALSAPAINVFPNPANQGESIYISFSALPDEEISVNIVNILGEQIYSEIIPVIKDMSASATYELNLYLTAGIYYFVVSAGSKRYYQKFIIK
ncbi:MAG: T9SS type A sorting domain-containing protein, partial [Bacteroidia bacterium]|nr:T9SS type A sorting domain-containing protein [Bacteroidia bacterium]